MKDEKGSQISDLKYDCCRIQCGAGLRSEIPFHASSFRIRCLISNIAGAFNLRSGI
jgi:hypothetical protein